MARECTGHVHQHAQHTRVIVLCCSAGSGLRYATLCKHLPGTHGVPALSVRQGGGQTASAGAPAWLQHVALGNAHLRAVLLAGAWVPGLSCATGRRAKSICWCACLAAAYSIGQCTFASCYASWCMGARLCCTIGWRASSRCWCACLTVAYGTDQQSCASSCTLVANAMPSLFLRSGGW